MIKLLACLLGLSLTTLGATVYQFSENFSNGTAGFTYIAPDYLSNSRNYIPASNFTVCDASVRPQWTCTGAYLTQSSVNGFPSVQITLALVYVPDPNDAFSTDQIDESFPGASLMLDGIYPAFLSNATLLIRSQPDAVDATAPEPGTWRLLALTGVIFVLFYYRRKQQSSASNRSLRTPL